MKTPDRAEALRRQADALPEATGWRARKRRSEVATRLYSQSYRLRSKRVIDDAELPF